MGGGSRESCWNKMADLSQPNDPMISKADEHLARLLVSEVEEPWYRSFWKNLKEAINPPKLPPLEVTSQPVAVKDIWGLYGRQNKSFLMSTGFQMAIVGVIVALSMTKPGQQIVKQTVALVLPTDIDPFQPKIPPKKQAMQGGGGGGARSPLPAPKGKLPKASLKQFTPPMVVVNNPNPRLMMEPTIISPIDIPSPNLPNYGDPLGKLGPLSNGPGSGGGIGSGSGGGVGSGKGGGVGPGEGGGVGGGVFRVGGGVTAPTLLYKKE